MWSLRPSQSWFIMMVMVCALAASGAQAQGPATRSAVKPKIHFVEKLKAKVPQKVVYFGTSLTQYGPWVGQVSAALEKAYPGLVTTYNGGKSGENSKWGLEHVQANVIDQNPDVVFIEFTTNDAVERFHLSVQDARTNIQTMIDRIRKARPECDIILQIMNPVIGKPKGDSGYRLDLPAYQQMYRDLGKEQNLVVIDHMPAWQSLLDQGEDKFREYVKDGLHPGGPGCAKYVTPTILKTLGVVVPAEPKK